MKKYIIITGIFILVFGCTHKTQKSVLKSTETYQTQLPKVLFITTGVNFETDQKDLPKGIIVAIQFFNKYGIPVILAPRDVLFDQTYLNKFGIIIMSTATGYHDADRKYSLSYMTDEELQHIKQYVAQGGTLIAGDNIGRNHFNGTDRIVNQKSLNSQNYPLSGVFGLSLIEKNMKGYSIKGKINTTLQGDLLPKISYDLWTLVPDSINSKQLTSWAYWVNGNDSLPAITQNKFQKGNAYLLASSDFLNPIVSEGYWSVAQIEAFYEEILQNYKQQKQIHISVNPWPAGYENAFCVSFNPQGDIENYKNVISFLDKKGLEASFFVDGRLNDTIREYLQNKNLVLASTGYRYWNYDDMDYALSVNDMLRNESKWQTKFDGFRFPYTNPVFNGLMALEEQHYQYESSISANNFEFLHGSVVPYNLVINRDGYYKNTHLLEVAPTYHDDYFFLDKLLDEGYKNPADLLKNVQLQSRYLLDYWKYSVKPYHGAMVYLGHPGITAYNQTTLQALNQIVDTVQKENTWVTTTDKLAAYRKKFLHLNILYSQTKNSQTLKVVLPENEKIPQLTINTGKKPKNVNVLKGKTQILERNNHFCIIFDAFNGQELRIDY